MKRKKKRRDKATVKRAKSEEREEREYSVARKGSVKREEMCANERRVKREE